MTDEPDDDGTRHLGSPAATSARAGAASATTTRSTRRHRLAQAALAAPRAAHRRRRSRSRSSRSSSSSSAAIFIAVGGLRADLGLEVRDRRRAPDPAPRDRATTSRRSAKGLHPKLPVFIPFLGAYVQYTRGHPWQTVARRDRRPDPRRRRARSSSTCSRSRDDSDLLLRARVLRLLPEPVQPDPVRDLRRRRGLALGALASRRRRRDKRDRLVRALLRDGRDADPRHGRVTRPAAPPVTDDRQILDHPATFDIDASVEKIAAEFRAGFEKVALIDRPAVALFGSARVHGGQRAVRGRAGGRPRFAEARLGGRHGRRRRRDGGREPRRAGGRRPLGRLQHQAAARAGAEPVRRHRATRSTTSTRARSASCARRRGS